MGGFLRSIGVRYMAPPVGQLIKANAAGTGIEPSDYALHVQAAGIKLITWTVERNYGCWPTTAAAYTTPACSSFNEFELIDTLSKMGVVGVFSDWPATTTFYASCVAHLKAVRPTATTCGEVRDLFRNNACCADSLDKVLATN